MTSKSTNKSTTNQTQTVDQTTKPTVDPMLDDYWRQLLTQTNTAVNGMDRTPYMGTVRAGQNQYDTRSITGMDTMLQGLGSRMTPGVFTNVALDAASGRMLDPATNPTLNPMIQASIRPITEQLERQIIPGIDNAAIMDNAFGGDRAALTRGQAYGDWAEAAGDISSGIHYDNYNRERQYQMMAPELFAQGLAAEAMPYQMYGQLGDYQRSLDQMSADDAIMRRALNEQLAFSGLGQAAQIYGSAPMVGQNTSGTTTSVGTSTQEQIQKANPITSVIQGGLGIGAMLGGLGWQPFAGGVAGAAGSAMGMIPGGNIFGSSGGGSGSPFGGIPAPTIPALPRTNPFGR